MGNIKLALYRIWYKHNHSIITAGLIIPACLFGIGLESLFVMSGYWMGREYAQAEYRFMKIEGITRDDLGFFQGLNPIAWNFDSLFNDLVLPILVGLAVLWCL